MSNGQFNDYAENRIVDMMRGQAWSLPASLYYGLASVGADDTVTELTGSGYSRVSLTRALSTWSGTQGVGSTTASTGTSHTISNNIAIDFGTAGANWGTANYLVVWDQSTGGNLVAYLPLSSSVNITSGTHFIIAIAAVSMSLGQSGGCSDYLANTLLDFIFRGQAYTWPTAMYVALMTALPTNAGGGVEVGASVGYVRAGITAGLIYLSGTQGAGSTVASTGNAGLTSNNLSLAFGTTTTGPWGTLVALAIYDANAAGNLLFWTPITNKTVGSGVTAPSISAGALTITFD